MSRTQVAHPADGINVFLNKVLVDFRLKNDAALARVFKIPPPIISKWRWGELTVSPHFLIILHEQTAIPIASLKEQLAGHLSTGRAKLTALTEGEVE